MHNTTVRNCTAHVVPGDDCFAMLARKPTPSPPIGRVPTASSNCTAQTFPLLAQAFSIYGGWTTTRSRTAKRSISPTVPGCSPGTTFPTEFGFHGTTTYRHINLIPPPAMAMAPIATVAKLDRLKTGCGFQDIKVIDSPTDGRQVHLDEWACAGVTQPLMIFAS